MSGTAELVRFTYAGPFAQETERNRERTSHSHCQRNNHARLPGLQLPLFHGQLLAPFAGRSARLG